MPGEPQGAAGPPPRSALVPRARLGVGDRKVGTRRPPSEQRVANWGAGPGESRDGRRGALGTPGTPAAEAEFERTGRLAAG